MTDDLNKARRLAIAATVAPDLRAKARSRRVARVDAEGNVVGYTTLAEVQAALLARRGIELAVQDDVRPSEVTCRRCGKPVPVGRGPVPSVCLDGCRSTCETPGCGRFVSRATARRRAHQGRPILCRSCGCKRRKHPPQTPEQRARQAEAVRARLASLTPEERRKRVQAALDGQTRARTEAAQARTQSSTSQGIIDD